VEVKKTVKKVKKPSKPEKQKYTKPVKIKPKNKTPKAEKSKT
jgi:hypothetical protein